MATLVDLSRVEVRVSGVVAASLTTVWPIVRQFGNLPFVRSIGRDPVSCALLVSTGALKAALYPYVKYYVLLSVCLTLDLVSRFNPSRVLTKIRDVQLGWLMSAYFWLSFPSGAFRHLAYASVYVVKLRNHILVF